MSSVIERNLELSPALESGLSNPSLNGTSLEIADCSLKSGLPEPVKEKNIIQEKLFSFENSSISSEVNIIEEYSHTDKSTNELSLQEVNSLTVIQDNDEGHNAFEGDVPETNSNVRCSLKGDEISSGQKCEISPGQISSEDNQASIASNHLSDCCPPACDETLHQKSSEQSSPKTDKTLISNSPALCVPDGQLISSNLPDDLANTTSGLPASSIDETVMTDLPDSSSTQSSSTTEFLGVSVGHADLVNEVLPHISDEHYSSNNNNLPHKKLCSNTSEPSTESHLPEPSNGFPDVSDFQPLILDVQGSYNENLLGCPTDIQETDNSSANSVTQQAEGKDTFLDTMESIPKSAMEMLRGIMQLNQINQSKTIPDAHVISNSANSSQELVTESTESVKTKPGYSNSILQNGTPDSGFNLLSQLANNKADGADQVATQMASLTRFPLTEEHASQYPHMITVNRIPVTCVLVQDTNSVSSNKVTLVIAKPGLLKPSHATGPEDSNKNSQILSTVSATDNALNETVINADNSVSSSPTQITTIKERVANLVDKTIEKFVMKGKDLQNSSILKIRSDTELKAMKHSNSSVQCSVCGEIYHNNISLSNHLGRTVFHLLYECPICKIGIVFYNKCALWKHLRNHCKTLQYNNILQFKPYDFKNNQTEEVELVSTADIASLNTRDKTADPIRKVLTLPLLSTICGLNTLEQGRSECLLKCSMCNLVHPQVTQSPSPQVSVDKTLIQSCPSCGMFLPSLCSFRAHIRLHTKAVNNMICPECGHITLKNSLSVDDMKKAAFDHMDECKHFNRVVVLSCFCKEEFMLVKQLAHHFMNKHLQTLFKCKFCLLAFTQHDHLLNHIKILHQNQYFAIEPSGIHVLCTYCQQLLKNPNEAKSHVETHVLNQKHKAVFKWKCFLCSKVFEDKEKLNEHSDREHPHKPKRCMICFILFCSRQNLVDHIMLKKCKQSTPMIYDQCVDIEQNLQLPDLNYSKLFMVPRSDNGPTKAAVSSLSRTFIRIAPKELSKINDSNCEIEKSTSGPPDPSSQEQCISTKTPVYPNPNLGIQKNVSSSGKMTAVQQISINPGKKSTLTGKKSTTLMQTCQQGPESQLESTFTVRKAIKKVFSCQVCQQKFAARNYYNSHMRAHEKKGEWNPNEKCDVCEMCLETSFLETHLKEHQAEGVVICSSCQSMEFQDMEGAMKHPDTGCALTRNTGLANSNQPCQKEMSEIPDKSCKANISQDVEKGVNANATNDEKNKEEDETNTSVFPCLLCGLAFHTLTMRENHVSRLHDGTRIVYQCLKCKKKKMSKVVFSKKESVVRHLIKKHRILKMDSVEKFIGIEEQNASSGHSLQQTEFVDSDDSSDPPPKRLRIAENGEYMCGKCGFLTTDSGEFCTHIATHNANNEPQCPECGLCFTVLPALMKHLFAVHKIRAVEEFLKSKNIKMPEFEADEPMEDAVFPVPTSPESYSNPNRHRSSPQNPLECTVCYKVLESELNLKTHMRNHGMAFIRSKRLQNIDDPANKD